MFHVKSVPPLPSHDLVEELTEKFSSHFVGKISKLHQRLNQTPTPKWSPAASSTCLCSLAEFFEVSMENHPGLAFQVMPSQPHTNSDSEGLPRQTAPDNHCHRKFINAWRYLSNSLQGRPSSARHQEGNTGPERFLQFPPYNKPRISVKSAWTYRCKPNSWLPHQEWPLPQSTIGLSGAPQHWNRLNSCAKWHPARYRPTPRSHTDAPRPLGCFRHYRPQHSHQETTQAVWVLWVCPQVV